MLHEILSKKYAKKVILLLNEYEELYFTQIQKKTGMYKSNLSKLLSYLEELGVVKRRIENIKDKKRWIPRAYFSLTPLGKVIAKYLLKLDELEKELEIELEKERKSMISVENSSNVIISIGDNNKNVIKNVDIKK